MTILANANAIGSSGVDVGDIGHSLRFAASRSCYMSIALTTSTTATYFGVLKRGKLGVISPIIDSYIKFNANDTLTAFGLTTTAVFRDPTAWLFWHVSNNGLYINGAYLGAVTTSAITNPRIGYDGTNYFDGYMARVGSVDGTSAYTNFGYKNTEINEWVTLSQSAVVSAVNGGASKGWLLDFDNGSSTTTLGYDKSSKGNNFTLSGHSLTAGVNYDWMLDVPGNSFPVINSLVPVNSTAPTISDANLKWTRASTAPGWTAASMPLPQSGKWYWETDHTSDASGAPLWTGVVNSTRGAADDNASNIAGVQAVTGGWDGKKTNATTVSSYINPGALTATIAHAYDGATGKYWCGYVSGGSITWGTNGGVGDPAAGTNALETLSGVVTPAFGQFETAGATRTITEYFNAGQRPFSASALPTGFKSICQANLPDVPAAYLNPRKHADVVTRTGAGSSYTKTGLLFQPGFIDTKVRNGTDAWNLVDEVRGNTHNLFSNNTNAEDTVSRLTSFNSDGYTFADGYAATNVNLGTFVDLCLKAGVTSGVSNNAGSITSTVSANTDSGFSIVTATLSASNGTVGHGCNVNGVATAPGLVIGFRRDSASSHPCWHSALTSGAYVVYLDTTAAQASSATTWNSTAPTSTVFSVGTGLTGNWVFYCFAPGFFSIGSYVGNGSTDGPYVYLGHKSRWLLIKGSTVASQWVLYDTARDTYNVSQNALLASTSVAESTGYGLYDIGSNYFKPRNQVTNETNTSGQTYIYISIPDVHAKYALAR